MAKAIGLITAGGDCPGMNAAVRAVAKTAILDFGYEVVGIEDGFDGLINGRWHRLKYSDVSGILDQGGTILGTSNSADPYDYAVRDGATVIKKDVSKTALHTIEELGVECLVCVGGDGSFSVASRLSGDGAKIVGVPKTIDNDVVCTDFTVGFNTAASIATEAIDRVHTSAESHHRVMIIEVMGRNAGWLGLYSGVAGGADIILIPEIPYEVEPIVELVRQRNKIGKRCTIIVISEGAKPKGGEVVVRRLVETSHEKVRLGGISFELAESIEDATGIESRALILGHLLRGGPPTCFDRVLATRLGTRAAELTAGGLYGVMVSLRGESLQTVPLTYVADRQKTVPMDDPVMKAARSVGTFFGGK